MLGRRIGGGILQHERLAGVQRLAQESEIGRNRLAHHVLPDRDFRPDRSHRSGIGYRLRLVYETRDGDYANICHYR